MTRCSIRRFKTAFLMIVLGISLSCTLFASNIPTQTSVIAAPVMGPIPTSVLPIAPKEPVVSAARDAQTKTDDLIENIFGRNTARDIEKTSFPRDEFTTALQNLSQTDRDLVFKKLMESISPQRKPITIGKILFSRLLNNSREKGFISADSLQILFRSIILVNTQMTDIMNSIMTSTASFILQKEPEEQGIILRGVNDIPDKDPEGRSRQRVNLLDKILEKRLLFPETSAINIIEMLNSFRLIPISKLGEYYRFVKEHKHKIFPKNLEQDAFSKIFRLFYEARDYQNLILSALNNTLVSPKVPLDQTIAILRAFNEIEPKEQDDFIKTLDDQFLLAKGMGPSHIASVLENLKNVPLREIPTIKNELITQKLIGAGWSGQDVAPLIRIIKSAQDPKDAYTRLILIKEISSPKFQHIDFSKLYDKTKIFETPQLKSMTLSFLRYFKSIQQWSASDTLSILRAISSIPSGYNNDILLQSVKVKIEISENDKSAKSIADFIKDATSQPPQVQNMGQQDLMNLINSQSSSGNFGQIPQTQSMIMPQLPPINTQQTMTIPPSTQGMMNTNPQQNMYNTQQMPQQTMFMPPQGPINMGPQQSIYDPDQAQGNYQDYPSYEQ